MATGAGDDAEQKIGDFAEDLGKMLGTARAKAEGWLGQRQAIVKNLTELRDTASQLLSELGHQAEHVVRRRRRRGRPAADQDGAVRRRPGRPPGRVARRSGRCQLRLEQRFQQLRRLAGLN